MKVKLNDREVEIAEGSTLAQLLDSKKMSTVKVATAVNDNVVPASQRATHILDDGDSILVIKAFYGG